MTVVTELKKPGRPSLSEYEKQNIRENIIDIARELFVKEGYENTSMRKIAGVAGFAPTKIYYYFENKKAILRHFWEDISVELWHFCRPSQKIIDGPPLEIVRHLMTKNIYYWLNHPKSYQLGIATQDFTADPSENFDVYKAFGTREYIDLMHHSVQRCIDENCFKTKDMLLVSQVIGMSVYGIYGAFYGLPMVDWDNKDHLIRSAIENTLAGLMANELPSENTP